MFRPLTITKVLFVILSFLHCKSSLAQDSIVSSQIYVVYKDTVEVFWPNEFELSPSKFPEFRKYADEYGIYRVRNSFYFLDDKFLSRTLTLYIQNSERLEGLMEVISGEDRIMLVEPKSIPQRSVVPNDTHYALRQAELRLIEAEQAWDISTGVGTIDVAVVDDAIQVSHPDLQQSIDSQWDVADNDPFASPPSTDFDHGTHVAGIVSATANNGQGVASIGFGGVEIIAVKAADGTTNAQGQIVIPFAYEGIAWAANNGAEIINCSFSGPDFSIVEQSVINNAWSQGCIIVAAAGNLGNDIPRYPAAYENVIAVANTRLDDSRNPSSNFGPWVDISAPGTLIYNTEVGDSYGYKSGTSMASPLVAGLIGLIWSVEPSRSRKEVLGCLFSSTDPISWSGGGFGRINANRAVSCATTDNTWVDYTYSGFQDGSFENPFDTLSEGVEAVSDGGVIYLKSSSEYQAQTIDVDKNFTIRTWNGVSVIGQQ